MTKREFDLIKEVINERIKLDDIGPAVRLVTLYNRHGLINNRVTKRLYNCIRNEIYITCSMYDEFKSLEDEKEVDRWLISCLQYWYLFYLLLLSLSTGFGLYYYLS